VFVVRLGFLRLTACQWLSGSVAQWLSGALLGIISFGPAPAAAVFLRKPEGNEQK